MGVIQSWKKVLCLVVGLVSLALAILLILWLVRPGALLKPVLENIHIKGLSLSVGDIGKIREGDKSARQKLVHKLVTLLKNDVKSSGLLIQVKEEDIILEKHFPDEEIVSGKVEVRASNVIGEGRILNSTNLTSSIGDTDMGLEAFLQTQVEAVINLKADLKVKTKAIIAWEQTFPMEVGTRGKVDISVMLAVSEIQLAMEEGDLVVNYNTRIELRGRMFDWNVDAVEMNNCDLKLGQLSIGSICPLVKSVFKNGLQAYLDKWTSFEAPRLLEKLERELNSKLGVRRSIDVIDF